MNIEIKDTKTFIDNRYPCWYAIFEDGDLNKPEHWRVGCKYMGTTDECILVSLDAPASVDFAIGLLKAFKRGGEFAVRKFDEESKI